MALTIHSYNFDENNDSVFFFQMKTPFDVSLILFVDCASAEICISSPLNIGKHPVFLITQKIKQLMMVQK